MLLASLFLPVAALLGVSATHDEEDESEREKDRFFSEDESESESESESEGRRRRKEDFLSKDPATRRRQERARARSERYRQQRRAASKKRTGCQAAGACPLATAAAAAAAPAAAAPFSVGTVNDEEEKRVRPTRAAPLGGGGGEGVNFHAAPARISASSAQAAPGYRTRHAGGGHLSHESSASHQLDRRTGESRISIVRRELPASAFTLHEGFGGASARPADPFAAREAARTGAETFGVSTQRRHETPFAQIRDPGSAGQGLAAGFGAASIPRNVFKTRDQLELRDPTPVVFRTQMNIGAPVSQIKVYQPASTVTDRLPSRAPEAAPRDVAVFGVRFGSAATGVRGQADSAHMNNVVLAQERRDAEQDLLQAASFQRYSEQAPAPPTRLFGVGDEADFARRAAIPADERQEHASYGQLAFGAPHAASFSTSNLPEAQVQTRAPTNAEILIMEQGTREDLRRGPATGPRATHTLADVSYEGYSRRGPSVLSTGRLPAPSSAGSVYLTSVSLLPSHAGGPGRKSFAETAFTHFGNVDRLPQDAAHVSRDQKQVYHDVTERRVQLDAAAADRGMLTRTADHVPFAAPHFEDVQRVTRSVSQPQTRVYTSSMQVGSGTFDRTLIF